MGNGNRGRGNPKNGFIMQAGILAVAGILSRVIGLLYNSPMTAIIGDEGNGYYEYAYKAYAIILLISSYSIPAAISKVIAQRLAAKEYRSAHRIFKGALFYVMVVGGTAGLLVFFFADWLVANLSGSAVVLRFFAPTIFLSGILGVLRGYFQAHGTMAQTSVSQIMEQIVNAAVSIWLAFVFTGLVPVGTAVGAEATKRAVYGAAGGAVGTGAGVVAGLFFMWGIYRLNRPLLRKRLDWDKSPEEESYREIFKMILLVVTPFILSTCIYNINTFLNQTIFNQVMSQVKKMPAVDIAVLNSAIGKATKISNIPIAIASAMSTALIPGIAGDFSQGRTLLCREKVGKAIRTTMFVAIPAAVGIGLLAKPIMMVLYPQKAVLDLSALLLAMMAVGVVFYSLSTLTSAVLQGIGRVNAPVINATIALGAQTVLLVAVLFLTDMGTYAMAAAVVLYALLMCILNALSVRKHLAYRQEWDKTFCRPLVASLLMGAAAFGTYHGLYYLCGINLLALAAAVVVGVGLYFVLSIKLKVIGEEELSRLPRGRWLVWVINGTGHRPGERRRRDEAEEFGPRGRWDKEEESAWGRRRSEGEAARRNREEERRSGESRGKSRRNEGNESDEKNRRNVRNEGNESDERNRGNGRDEGYERNREYERNRRNARNKGNERNRRNEIEEDDYWLDE